MMHPAELSCFGKRTGSSLRRRGPAGTVGQQGPFLRALLTSETELKLIAAAAMIGLLVGSNRARMVSDELVFHRYRLAFRRTIGLPRSSRICPFSNSRLKIQRNRSCDCGMMYPQPAAVNAGGSGGLNLSANDPG